MIDGSRWEVEVYMGNGWTFRVRIMVQGKCTNTLKGRFCCGWPGMCVLSMKTPKDCKNVLKHFLGLALHSLSLQSLSPLLVYDPPPRVECSCTFTVYHFSFKPFLFIVTGC